MAVELASAYISLIPSAAGISERLRRELGAPVDRAARDAGESAARSFTSPMSGALKSLAKLAAGALAIGGLSSFIDAARESEKIAKQTAQVILTTGSAANVSAEYVGEYAGQLAALTGVDDELIQTGQNMLLTFTKVRNEVGAGNDIFDQATNAALDMSVALGTDMQGASLLVGKALNDPLKGLTALTRSGVSFTAQQKEQVKALVESGDVMGAQKIILGELQTQFGGTAAALADPWDRFKVVLGNLQEQIGGFLLPVLNRVITFVAEYLPVALETAGRWWGTFLERARAVWEFLAPFVTQLVEWFREQVPRALETAGQWLGTLAAKGRELWDWARPFIEWLKANWQPVVIGVATVIAGHLVAAFAAWVVAAGAAAIATLTAVAGPLALAAALAALVAGLVWAYQNVEGFREVVDAVVRFFLDVVVPGIADFARSIIDQFAALVGWVQDHWDQIREAIEHVINVVRGIIEIFIGVVQRIWQAFGDEITRIASVAWDAIRLVVETAINVVRGIIEFVLALINGDWGKAWDAIKSILSAVWDFMKGIVQAAIDLVMQIIEGALSAIRLVWETAWNAVSAVLSGVWNGFVGIISGAWDGVKSFLTGIIDWVKGTLSAIWDPFESATKRVWDGLKSAIGVPLRVVGDIVGTFLKVVATIAGAVGLDSLAGTLRDASGDAYGWGQGFAAGGTLPHKGLSPFVTSGPLAIVGEGNPRFPEWVIPTDPRYRDRAQELHQQVGARLYAGGGQIGDAREDDPIAGGGLLGGTPNVLGAVIDVARDVLAGALEAVWPVLGVGPGLAGIPPSGVNTARTGVIDFIRGKAQEIVDAQPTLNTSGGYQALIDYLVGTGVPHVVTSTYRPGSITASGNLSRHALGLAADFARTRGAGYDHAGLMPIFDAFGPVESQLNELIYSGAPYNIKNGKRVGRYAVAQHWDHVHAALDQGAFFRRPTMLHGTTIAEHGPEIVSPVSQLRRVLADQADLPSNSRDGFAGTIKVYLGDREITDIVRVEVDRSDRDKSRGEQAGTSGLRR